MIAHLRVSWVVATLIRLGEQPAAISWLDLWLERRPVEVPIDSEQDAQFAEYGVEAGGCTAMHSLARRLIDATARRSYELSHLQLHNEEHALDPVPVYTESLLANMEAAFVITDRFFGRTMNEKKPELWARALAEYDRLCKDTVEYNRPRILLGRKQKEALLITWPQAVCMGIPFLANRCYALRSELAERERRLGHLESRTSEQLLNRYCDALHDYCVLAILLDDSLRVKNYSGAMAGIHVKPVPVRNGAGKWIAFSEARTLFSGLDEFSVALKARTKLERGTNKRDRPLTPGIVDHVLLFEFWTVARPRTLFAAGLLQSVESFNPDDDTFAVFPTPRPSADQMARYHAEQSAYEAAVAGASIDGESTKCAPPRWRGNLSEDMLSDSFGRSLHEICVTVLGRVLPGYESPELTAKYRGLFAAHIVRLLVGTYFGGVRDRWRDAEYRTNDAEITLRRHYNRLSDWFEERMHVRGPEGVHWFDAVIDRVLERRAEDSSVWSMFWREFEPRDPLRGFAKSTDSGEQRRKARTTSAA